MACSSTTNDTTITRNPASPKITDVRNPATKIDSPTTVPSAPQRTRRAALAGAERVRT